MILNAIINFAYYMLAGIISWLPTSNGFPQEAHDAMSGLGGYVDIWTPILPMDVLLSTVTLVISIEIAIFGFKTVKWLISHIPYIGGRG